MIKIKHPASTLPYETVKTYLAAQTNLIDINFQTATGQINTVSVNRFAFIKGCGSEALEEASKNQEKSVTFNLPEQLGQVFETPEFVKIIQQWITYLPKGELQFSPKHLGYFLTLACSFEVRPFINCLIDQNVKLPLEHRLAKTLIFKCCFDTYTHILNQDGKYNFIWWMFRTYNYNWMELAVNQFEDDQPTMESFIQQYSHYKGQNGLINDNDIEDLINFYKKRQGKPAEEAKLKVKKLIHWESTPIEVLEANKVGLRFTDNQIRTILQKRLNNLIRIEEEGMVDDELLELRRVRDQLKQRHQRLVIEQGEQQMHLELTKTGSYQEKKKQSPKPAPKPQQPSSKAFSMKKSQQYEDNEDFYALQDYQQVEQISSPSKPIYPNLSNTNANVQKRDSNEEEAELKIELEKVLKKGAPRGKKQQQISLQPKKTGPQQQKKSNNKVRHVAQNEHCTCKKSFSLSCGCQNCYDCFKMRYVQKTELWAYFEEPDLPIKPEDFRKYGVKCYQCQAPMTEMDAVAYNSV